jgi:hypothetical protein
MGSGRSGSPGYHAKVHAFGERGARHPQAVTHPAKGLLLTGPPDRSRPNAPRPRIPVGEDGITSLEQDGDAVGFGSCTRSSLCRRASSITAKDLVELYGSALPGPLHRFGQMVGIRSAARLVEEFVQGPGVQSSLGALEDLVQLLGICTGED